MFGGGVPFEHFMGGGREFSSQMRRPEADTSEYYDLLGVDKNASESEIKKAFRKKAMKSHPDRGGDPEEFKKISEAYEILSDANKKSQYDKFGKEGVDSNGGGMNSEDIFSQMFGGGRSTRTPEKKKAEDISHQLKVDLEGFYNGKQSKLSVKYNVVVNKESKVKECKHCNSSGVVYQMRKIGPGMVQQVQTKCPSCNGTGYSAKMKLESKIIVVNIEKGMKSGHKLKFREQGNELPGGITGDVVITIVQKPHAKFERKGSHLFMTKTLLLSEALCGSEFIVKHMDNRKLLVSTSDIIKNNAYKMIPNEGMPIHENPYDKGNLIIKFDIKFPINNSFSEIQLNALKLALPQPDKINDKDIKECEKHDLQYFDPARAQKDYVENRQAYDSDDGDEDHARIHGNQQGMQCAQQ
jgi:DnaJ family protein A protein 2